MIYVWSVLFILVNLGWLVLTLFGLPGNWLIVLMTAGVLWWQRGAAEAGGVELFSLWTLITVAALAAIGEIIEFLTGVFGSASAGGTRWGSGGALVGGIVGGVLGSFIPFLPVVNTLIGACIGAAAAALIFERVGGKRTWTDSARSGMGAGIGTFFGRVAKVVVGAAMWLITSIAIFWP